TSNQKVTYEIPNSKYILQPILRKSFEEYKDLTIEVLPYVETKNITAHEVQELYDHLRDEGLTWTDIKFKNVGRLIKPNKGKYNMRTGELNTSFENTALIGDVDTLEPGNVVLIVSDYIYDKVTKKTKIPDEDVYLEFENRYINTKSK
ncbi:MAG: hypothetical protein K6B70_06935, partial [Clostridia bacterium]|nr:hypothetical protein [Clostridia bacterium]